MKRKFDKPDDSEMVTFYLGYQEGMRRDREYVIPITVNGYRYQAKFGRKNRLPRQVVEVLLNSKSAIHPSPNAARVDQAIGGEGPPISQGRRPWDEQYIPDYDVVIDKVEQVGSDTPTRG